MSPGTMTLEKLLNADCQMPSATVSVVECPSLWPSRFGPGYRLTRYATMTRGHVRSICMPQMLFLSRLLLAAARVTMLSAWEYVSGVVTNARTSST